MKNSLLSGIATVLALVFSVGALCYLLNPDPVSSDRLVEFVGDDSCREAEISRQILNNNLIYEKNLEAVLFKCKYDSNHKQAYAEQRSAVVRFKTSSTTIESK